MPAASAAIIGEPSMMKVVSGHKGGYGWRVHVHGFEVHSSLMHTGVSAIMEGARLIMWANEMNDEIRARTPSATAAQFEPPFTTVHTGMISGGTANNITAKDCAFSIDFRLVPGDNIQDYADRLMAKVAEVEAQMQAVVPETRIEIEQRFHVPGLRPEEDGAAESATAQRPASSKSKTTPPSSAGPATSRRRINPTSSFQWTSSNRAKPSWHGWWINWRRGATALATFPSI